MVAWDLYRGEELIAAVGTTEELMAKVGWLLKHNGGRVSSGRPLVIRPGGSPVIGRVERVEDTFRCPACTLAVQVGDVFVTGNDGRRVCSVFCQRRLTKGR